jgi:uncharacterized protein involved in exopolysaccharide biosynthesis
MNASDPGASSLELDNHGFDPKTTLREVGAALHRDRKLILLAFAVPMLLFILVSLVPKPLFESKTSLLVRLGREYVYNAENGEGGAQPMTFDRDQMLHAESEILSSRDVIDRALQEVGIANVYPSIANDVKASPAKQMALAAERVDEHLKAELLKDSNVLEVTFGHPDPNIAARLVNSIVSAYLDRRRAIFLSPRSAFLEEQVDKYQRHLAEVENALTSFQHAHEVVSFDQQLSLLLDQRNALELKLDDAAQDTGANTTRVQALNRSIKEVPASILLSHETQPSGSVDAAKQKLLDLQLKERELTNKYFDDSPLVVDMRKQIGDAQQFIREQHAQPHEIVRDGRNPVRDTLESDVVRARADADASAARRAVLQDQLSSVAQRVAELSSVQQRIVDMKREQKLVEDGYGTYVRKLQDARVMDERDQKAQTNVSVIQRGLPPITSKSYGLLIIGVGFLLSLCFALLVVFARALMRDTFLLPEGVERALGLPVLADLPAMR